MLLTIEYMNDVQAYLALHENEFMQACLFYYVIRRRISRSGRLRRWVKRRKCATSKWPQWQKPSLSRRAEPARMVDPLAALDHVFLVAILVRIAAMLLPVMPQPPPRPRAKQRQSWARALPPLQAQNRARVERERERELERSLSKPACFPFFSFYLFFFSPSLQTLFSIALPIHAAPKPVIYILQGKKKKEREETSPTHPFS